MRLSIIMPFYKKEENVVRLAVESILNQTFRDLELICVNDASPDNSADFLYQIAASDSRMKVITHECNKGVSAARNSALAVAEGDYIGFIDSDDMAVPNYYEVMLKTAEITNADIVSSTFRRIKYDDNKCVSCKFNEKQLRKYRGGKKYYAFKDRSIWNRIYKKECLAGITFAEDLRVYEDLVFLNQVIVKAKNVCDIEFPGYLYRHLNPNRPRKAPAADIEVPLFIRQNILSLDKILAIAESEKDNRSCQAMAHLVLRRFMRISLQMRKYEVLKREAVFMFQREFCLQRMIDVCKDFYPLICALTEKCWAQDIYSKRLIWQIQFIRLLIEFVNV